MTTPPGHRPADPTADLVGLPADDLAGLLDQALQDDVPTLPPAFVKDAPYSLEELLCGLPPVAENEDGERERHLEPALLLTEVAPPDHQPASGWVDAADAPANEDDSDAAAAVPATDTPQPSLLDDLRQAAPEPSTEVVADLAVSSGDDADPTTLALSSIVSALRAMADREDPPPLLPTEGDSADDEEESDDELLLTDEFLAPEPEETPAPAPDDATSRALETIVTTLQSLADQDDDAPPPPFSAEEEEEEGEESAEALVLTDEFLAPEPAAPHAEPAPVQLDTTPPAAPIPLPAATGEEEDTALVLTDDFLVSEPAAPHAEPAPEHAETPVPPEPAMPVEPLAAATQPQADDDDGPSEPPPSPAIAWNTVVDAIITAHTPAGAVPTAAGDPALPEKLDALALVLGDPPPADDFTALDALYACWPKATTDSPSRALLASAQNLSRNFGLPGKLPMSSAKAWRMLSPSVFEGELVQRLADIGTFIANWQKTQRTFLILEFGEIELIEYLFEALHPGYHADALAGVMNFKVLSNRRMGLLRRIPIRVKKQISPLLPDNKQRAMMELAHAKALLERVAGETGFAPIAEAAAKAQEEVEKLMKAVANIGVPPPPPGPGGLALGRIG